MLAAVLRFARIGHQGFWFDEGNTALLVHFSPGKMLGLIPQTESTPPLYYCLAWVWARIFGYGETGLRSLSALAGVASVPLVYGAAAKLISRRGGLIAAALVACNPYLVWYSQEARSYSLLVTLTAASLLAFAYARAMPTPRRLLLWVLACGLALATHYYALLVIVPEALWLLAEGWRRRPGAGRSWRRGSVRRRVDPAGNQPERDGPCQLDRADPARRAPRADLPAVPEGLPGPRPGDSLPDRSRGGAAGAGAAR